MDMEDGPADMNKDGSKPSDVADDTNDLTLPQQEEKEFQIYCNKVDSI